MRTDEFDFKLPERLIAQTPPEKRGASRLLHLTENSWNDLQFVDLPGLVRENDVLIFNDTRVLKARLFGTKSTGGQVEVLVERILGEHEALAQIRASKTPKPDSRLLLAEVLPVTVLERAGEFYRLRFDSAEGVDALLEQHGQLPLPPYITHAADASDEERYQTVFAREPGAVAAPTAGLHFDEEMLAALRLRGAQIAYVTLHVGAGTFQPVRVKDTQEHVMHSERYSISQITLETIRQARRLGGRVIAVGTTSLRALESAALREVAVERLPHQGGVKREIKAGEGETNIFITPGYHFNVVDVLLTNFHLPKSTLLMLVCAFGGMERMLAAYSHAVEQEYRFFSYGDAMLIERKV
jgi:S-adenosylmethionine:tRNA ribosyltransferase-isomerase